VGRRISARRRSKLAEIQSNSSSLSTIDATLARAQAGDFEAFSELIKTHDDQMRALAYRCLGSRNLMEDALQTAYIRCFRSIANFRHDASFGTWLHRIVYNVCHDMRRKADRVAEVTLERIEDLAHDGSFEDQLVEHDQLRAALLALPFDQRAVLVLVDSQGLSYDEVAEVLEIANGTVASRLHRARHSVRRQLGTNEDDRS